jgi:hypothetical protein
VSLFRNILEQEIKLKEKIVTDFIKALPVNDFDINMASHSMRGQFDYVVLLRKLIGYHIAQGKFKMSKTKSFMGTQMVLP